MQKEAMAGPIIRCDAERTNHDYAEYRRDIRHAGVVTNDCSQLAVASS